jgi:UDP-N-acetylglucosamine 2-epimerase
MKKVLTIFGTRPEAIKLAPVIVELKKYSHIGLRVCVTAQHRQMLDQVLGLFGIVPDIDLDLMQTGQTLAELTARVIVQVERVLREEKPDVIIVQGDTTTVMAASMAAFYRNVKVAHVEAGLRSGDLFSPFPEEMNRRVTTLFSGLHFAPTKRAVDALVQEGTPKDRIYLTGNPVIDALQMILEKPVPGEAETLLRQAWLDGDGRHRRLILVTAHRRENFGKRFESLCHGIKSLAQRNPDITFIYPVHLNPNVQEPVYRILGNTERVLLTSPVEYDVLAHLMKSSYLILTDSGGIQEEAPSLGKPVLVMRTETERPEGIEAGTAKLVGPDAGRIVTEAEILLRDAEAYRRMAKAVNPYGDGKAARRIADILLAQI